MRLLKKSLIVLSIALSALCAGSVQAQTGRASLSAPPAEKYAIGRGGVDLRTGTYVYKPLDLSSGAASDSGALSLSRSIENEVLGHVNPLGNFSHNWDIMLTLKSVDINGGRFEDGSGPDAQVSVHSGGRAQTFREQGNTGFSIVSKSGWGGLTFNSGSGVYTYTGSDGTVVVFRPVTRTECTPNVMCAYASSVTTADGTKFTLAYETQSTGTQRARLKSVTSTRGYALLFEYGGSNWPLVSKACLLNLTQAPLPTSGSCPSPALSAVSYSYVGFYGDRLASVTDAASKTWTYTYGVSGNGMSMAFVKPGASAPWLTNYFSNQNNVDGVIQEVVGYQVFADGRTYSYVYDYPPSVDGIPPVATGGEVTDNLGKTFTVKYDFPIVPGTQPGGACPPTGWCQYSYFGDTQYQQTTDPVKIIDELGRTTTNDLCDPNILNNPPPYRGCLVMLLQSTKDPEGGVTKYTWDNYIQVVTQIRKIAKPGLSLPDIVTSAAYGCTQPACLTKPTSITDARGKVSTFSYDTTHGGLLTETSPADANGVQAVKRYAYVQRSAWISNGSGGYVQAAAPVWLLSTMKTCRATATTTSDSCSGGAADEVVTTYEYGPDTGLVGNTLLLRGVAVTAEVNGAMTTLRTCFTYDALGRKISETKPIGTSPTAVCS